MAIFRDNAPLYWEAGLPVIPLKQWNSPVSGAGKAPILSEWNQYGQHMPARAVREHWLENFPNSNIGLPFGPASGLCAIDIDTEDEEQVKAILAVLPKSPWIRIGKKGMGLVFKWQGQKNFKLRDSDNHSIVEFLGFGNQMVMPPSVHPDTGKPYTANCNLWEVLPSVPAMPLDIERELRTALGDRGYTLSTAGRSAPLQVVPEGERDIQMVRHAGYLARVVLGIDKNQKFSLREAIEHMHTWVLDFTARSAGDNMDPNKGVSKLLEFLLKDVTAGRTLPDGWDTGLTEEMRADPVIADITDKNQVQRWTWTKARTWLNEQIARQPGDPEYAWKKINELCDLLARDDQFKEKDFKLVYDAMQLAMGDVKVAKPDLLKVFKEAKVGDDEMALDQEAIARQVIEEISRGGELVYDREFFWQWNGSCFEPMKDETITTWIAQNIKGNVLARRYNDYHAITKTAALLVSKPLAEQFEHGINFANGYLTSDLKLHTHEPRYGQTYTMSFDYIPARAGEAHKWLQFLEDCWGDDPDYNEKVLALQEAFAATMFGRATEYQRAFLLYGRAGTGKSTALEVLSRMMPRDAQCSVPPTRWNERFQLHPMVGKTLNVCGELPEKALLDGATFKSVVCGERQQTELKGKPIIEFKPQAAQWFASNFLPRSRDTSEGFIRRWQLFEFTRVVPVEKRIPDFHDTLVSEEREAIAAWAVQGFARLQRNGDYTQPASHLKLLSMVRSANNSVVAFLNTTEKLVKDPEGRADIRSVFDHYVLHMRDISRGWSVTFERFRQMITDVGYRLEEYIDGTGVTREEIVGIRLKGVVLP